MKIVFAKLLVLLTICAEGTFGAQNAFAQDIKRCDGAGGKVTYAETCPPGMMASTMTTKGVSVTESDKRLRADEAAFQKRQAVRDRALDSERRSNRSAALAERRQAMAEEKMQRELALKEDKAKRGERKVRVPKKSKKKKDE